MSLADRISTPDGKRRHVRSLFATIADRYDFITVFLSFGLNRGWKQRLVDRAAPRADERVLDLATGTGDIAFATGRRGAHVVGLDVTLRMIELARARAPLGGGGHSVRAVFLVGDMQALPFPNASFDIVTTGYGLRNVPDLAGALDEIHRVLKPGGRTLSLDFNRPSNPIVRGLYLRYLAIVGGALGWVLHGDPDTYRSIPASIRIYPGAAGVSRLMEARGFMHVRHSRVLGGLMAIHEAEKRSEA